MNKKMFQICSVPNIFKIKKASKNYKCYICGFTNVVKVFPSQQIHFLPFFTKEYSFHDFFHKRL